jgi:hypothetical protein
VPQTGFSGWTAVETESSRGGRQRRYWYPNTAYHIYMYIYIYLYIYSRMQSSSPRVVLLYALPPWSLSSRPQPRPRFTDSHTSHRQSSEVYMVRLSLVRSTPLPRLAAAARMQRPVRTTPRHPPAPKNRRMIRRKGPARDDARKKTKQNRYHFVDTSFEHVDDDGTPASAYFDCETSSFRRTVDIVTS